MRPFVEADVPQVADLHRRVFRTRPAENGWLDAYRRYFADVFLGRPGADFRLSSLVYEREGTVLGFLGIMPRRMVFEGKPVLMAVCSQFVVDPAGRGQVGLRLLKECFEGPQDLTISDEAGDSTRTIWEWCGGESVVPSSLRWIKPLRVAQLGLSTLEAHPSMRDLARGATPLARLVDGLTRRILPVSFRIAQTDGWREELDVPTFLACLPAVAGRFSFCPAYDARSAAWVFERAGRGAGVRALRKVVVRDRTNGFKGWFLYAISRNATAEVLQVAARPDAVDYVLDHLFADAMERGAIAVSGRLDASLLPFLSAKRLFLQRGSHWLLLHSRDAALRHALHRGDSFLSRLEGEWCLRFA